MLALGGFDGELVYVVGFLLQILIVIPQMWITNMCKSTVLLCVFEHRLWLLWTWRLLHFSFVRLAVDVLD